MSPALRGDLRQPRAATLAALAILSLLAAARLALLHVRAPFFDELFTSWIARRPLEAMLQALALDSGPPLYYAVVNLFTGGSVLDARYVSFAAALAGAAILVAARSLGDSRWIAALLLAVYPPAVYFASEARAYALCGAFAGIAAIALDRWMEDGRRGDLAVGIASIVLAGHTHYYGILFAPLALILVLAERRRERLRPALVASVLCAVALLPAVWLASRQPAEAMRWIVPMSAGERVLAAARQIGFATPYPEGFLPQPTAFVQFISIVAMAITAAFSLRDLRARRFGIMWLLPLAMAVAASLVRPVYFPFRFEAVIAVPFVLWVARGISGAPRALRTTIVVLLVIVGAVAVYHGVIDHARGVIDPHREVAQFARLRSDRRTPVVVSGLAYLEVLAQRDSRWDPEVLTLPKSQAAHPGWRAIESPDVLRSEAASLSGATGPEIVWIGELGSPEHRAMSETWHLEVRFVSGGVAIATARSMGVRQ